MVAEEEAAFLSVERKAGEEPKAFGICVLLKLYYPNETKCVGVAVNRHRDVNNTPNKFQRKSCCLSSLSEKRESNVPFLVLDVISYEYVSFVSDCPIDIHSFDSSCLHSNSKPCRRTEEPFTIVSTILFCLVM